MPATLKTFYRVSKRGRQRSGAVVARENMTPMVVCLLLAFSGILLSLPQTYFRNLAHTLSHGIVLGVAALILSRSERGLFRVRPEFAVLGCLWFISICSAALIHSETMMALVNYIRYYILVPAGLIVCGRYLSRQPSRWTILMFALNGAFNLALMYWYISASGEHVQTEGGDWVGGDTRAYLDQLDGSVIIGPAALSNCAAVFAGGLFLVCRGIMPLKIVQAILLAGGCYLGIITGTRTPLLAMFGTAVVLALAMFRKGLLSAGKILAGVGAALLVFSGVWLLSQDAESSRADRFSLETITDPTMTGRTDIWADRLARIEANPFGLGYLGSRDDSGLSAHNNYLEAFISHGWLAGVTFTLLALALAYRAGLLVWSPNGSTHQLACASVLGWCLLVGLVEAFSQSYPQVNAVWWFAVGSFGVFSDGSRHRSKTGSTQGGSTSRPGPTDRPTRSFSSSRRRPLSR